MQRTYCKLLALKRIGVLKELTPYISAPSKNLHSICSGKFGGASCDGGNRIWLKYLARNLNRNVVRNKSKLAAASQKVSLGRDEQTHVEDAETDVLKRHKKEILENSRDLSRNANDVDEKLTIFMRKSNHHIDMKYGNKHREDFSLFLPSADELINIYFKPRKEIDVDDKVDPKTPVPGRPPAMQSTDELLWYEQKSDIRKLPGYYVALSKSRLTALIVLTAMGGYAMAPGAFHLSTFMFATAGTALLSCSANSLNMFFEVPYDSQMNRTKNRVLVRGLITPLNAVGFAAASGLLGYSILFFGANPLTASLGLFNLILYSCVYTPMKRVTIYNTWIGSCVGALPPMMGWAACTGSLEPGAWLLGAMLFAWQFPHFNALSWNLRADYCRGGYRMMSVADPDLCKRVAFRYCLVMTGLCLAAPVVDMTTWTFAADSLPLNIYLSYLGYRFYRDGDANSSRKLFKFTLLHIPLLFTLLLLSKNRSSKDVKSVRDPMLIDA